MLSCHQGKSAELRWQRHPPSAGEAAYRAPFYGLYEPGTRTIYVNGFPRNARAVGALLDAVLHIDRTLTIAASSGPPEGVRQETKPTLQLAKGSRQPERPKDRDSDDC